MHKAQNGWPHLYINGRFLAQRQTGVQRFAREVVQAIDRLMDDAYADLRGRVSLVTPKGMELPFKLSQMKHKKGGAFSGRYAWEQFDLPCLSADGILLNLANLGPLAKRRQVVVIHDATPHAIPSAFSKKFRLAYSLLLPRLARRAARLATISEFSRAEIAKWLRVPPDRLAICYEGAEHILDAPADRSVVDRHDLAATPFIIAVGMGAANKNLPLLFDAFSRAQLGNVKLVLTGRRSTRVHGASELASPENVVHVGHVTDAELRALYEMAQALVFPSSYEGFGLPPLEAMACGCPVIVSAQPALVEIAGPSALIVPMNDADQLAGGIRQINADTGLRRQLAESGRSRAGMFTWRSTAERLLAQCRAAA